MRIAPFLTLVLLAVPSAGWAKTSLTAESVRRPVCYRTLPAVPPRNKRTVQVPCTAYSIPPLLNPTPYFLP